MKTLYKRNWLSSLKSTLLLTAAVLFSATSFAQLSGTSYVIDKGGTASSTVYKSFGAFFSDLQSGTRSDGATANGPGVSGAVVVTVKSGSGPYTEQVLVKAITGASSTNTITVKGNMETLTNTSSSSSSSYTVRLDGADYMTWDSLTVVAAGSSYGRCFHLMNSADNNTIKNCELQIPNISSTSNYNAYITISNGTTSPTTSGDPGENILIEGNKMHNNSSTANNAPYAGIYIANETSGSTVHKVTVKNNEISDWYYAGIYGRYNLEPDYSGNDIHNTGRTRSARQYGIYQYVRNKGFAVNIKDNYIHDFSSGSGFQWYYGVYVDAWRGKGSKNMDISGNRINIKHPYYVYGIYGYAYQAEDASGDIRCVDNDIYLESYNSTTAYAYGIFSYPYYQASARAYIVDNKIEMDGAGSCYGIYHYAYYQEPSDANLIANNQLILRKNNYVRGIYMYGYLATEPTHMVYNTLYCTKPSTGTHTGRTFQGMWPYYDADGEVYNNIISCDWNEGSITGFYYWDRGTSPIFDNNNLHLGHNTNANVIYAYDNGTNITSLTDWIAGDGGANAIDVDPVFVDPANDNMTPSSFEMVNKGKAFSDVPKDFYGTVRSTTTPDLGAIEFFIDAEITSLNMTGGSECGGYSEAVSITMKNNSLYPIKDIPVQYDINGGTPVVEVIEMTIKPDSSYTFVFANVPEFNGDGTHKLTATIAGTDDKTTNHTLDHTITTTAAPYGASLTQGATFPGYFRLGGGGGTMSNPDVTIPGAEIEYEIQNPTKLSGSDYGTATGWTLTGVHATASGTPITSGITFTAPSATATGSIKFDPDVALYDSLVYIGFTATDLSTGCDSTFGRYVFVPHMPTPDFTVSDVCDGTVLEFVNNSKLEKGIMVYNWNFNDPNSTEDQSDISDPVYKYETFGNYTVDLEISTFEYPKFVKKISKNVTVFPVPTVDFTVLNACEGLDLTFDNNTKAPIAGTIDYTWNFGDGNTSTLEDPKHQYAAPGGYQVSLTASLNGCAATLVKNANQFDRPTAAFEVNGLCNLEDVEFTNGSTIEIGNTGYRWDFGDNTISNLENPTHEFQMAGSHTVKLRAISEFGCEDSTTRTFSLNESPAADFSFSDPCNLTEIEFTREGTVPAGAAIWEWDFNGEGVSTQENPKHLFSRVGVKNVTFKITHENGCSDEISKDMVVKLQAQAAFTANSVCEGEEVVFTNKSEVAAGNLEYTWRFGDGTTSTLTSPRHPYMLSTPGEDETFNVTLVAIVPGGCSDSISAPVNVSAASNPMFAAKAVGRMLEISNQATTSTDNIYNWRFGDGGSSSDVTPSYEYYNVDAGTFEVCLNIINKANCASEHCEEVTVDLLGLRDLDWRNDMIKAYPNPNNGDFKLDVKDAQNDLKIVVSNIMGEVVTVVEPSDRSGSYNISLNNVAPGVYFVQVKNGEFAAVQKITVSK